MSMLTRSGLGAVLAAVILGALGWWWNYEELVIAAAAIAALLLLSIWVSQLPLRATVTRRLVSVRVPRRDPIVLEYRLHNRTRFRSGRATIIDRCDDEVARTAVPPVAANSETTVTGTIPTRRRGVFDVGPLESDRVDRLWFCGGRRGDAQHSSVIVQPMVYDVAGPLGGVRVVESEWVLRRATSDPMSGFVTRR